MNLAEQLDFMTNKRRDIASYDLQILSLLEKKELPPLKKLESLKE